MVVPAGQLASAAGRLAGQPGWHGLLADMARGSEAERRKLTCSCAYYSTASDPNREYFESTIHVTRGKRKHACTHSKQRGVRYE